MISPIGMFDSGLGGLSVVSQVMRLLPNEEVAYLADSFHVPYGERPLEEIEEFGIGIADFLIERGAKALVIACNMMSAVALGQVRKRHPLVPIIGVIEPGVKVAVNISHGEPIGILATTGTVKSEAYRKAIACIDPSVPVIQQACPQFVPLVEAGMADSEKSMECAQEYVNVLVQGGCKVIVLGCTHYPFLASAIRLAAGPEVAIVDPAEETARVLKRTLSEHNLLGDRSNPSHSFYVTGNKDKFALLGGSFLGHPIETVHSVSWNVHLGQKTCLSG